MARHKTGQDAARFPSDEPPLRRIGTELLRRTVLNHLVNKKKWKLVFEMIAHNLISSYIEEINSALVNRSIMCIDFKQEALVHSFMNSFY